MKFIEFDNRQRASLIFALEEYIVNNPCYNDDYFFLWNTVPTLVIGRFQNTVAGINMDYAVENNIQIVRRNSGGGTMYIEPNSWQFSFVTTKKDAEFKGYREFTKPIIDALKIMGVEASFTGRNDLIANGKKFSGNSQFSTKNKMVHHGTLMFDASIENMVKALNVDGEKLLSKGIRSVSERVTNIRPLLNNPQMTSAEFYKNLVSLVDKDMQTIHITNDEMSVIEKIEKEKFLSWDWVFGKSPAFNISKSERFDGVGQISVQMDIQNDSIRECRIFGDFFCFGKISDLQDKLKGTKYSHDEVLQALQSLSSENLPIGINPEDLATLIVGK